MGFVTVTIPDGFGRATVQAEVTPDWRIKSAVMLSGGRQIQIISSELLEKTRLAVLQAKNRPWPEVVKDETFPDRLTPSSGIFAKKPPKVRGLFLF